MSDTKLNLKISLPDDAEKQRFVTEKYVTLDQVISWIKTRGYDDYITKELVKKVSKYPMNTYYKFRDDLQRHIGNIQENRGK